MNISQTFIQRPIATILLTVGLGFFGTLACLRLPVSDLPNVDFPTIQVSASLPGASPATMATAVATPLEKQFSTIASLDSMSSVASEGSAQITLQFALDRNIDAAAQDVQTAIAAASRALPADMPTPPSFRKVNPADSSVIILTLSSATLPISKVDEYAENLLAQRISTLPDVAQVQVGGQQKYAVRVQLDPNRLAAMGLGIDEVAQAVQNGNVNLPTGTLNGAQRAYQIEASGQLLDASAFRPLTVAYRNGAPVRLQALGNIIDATENDKMGAWVGPEQQQGVVLQVSRQPGSNAVELADSIREVLPTLREQLPAGLDLRVLYDRSQTIRAAVSDVRFTLMLSVVLVVIVIFLFLRSISRGVHSEHRDSPVARGHVRRDVPDALQHRQPVADGADAVHRLHRRRCHRDAREHLAAYRSGHGTAQSRAARRGRDRLHDPVDDDFARGGVHSAAVHGRHRRAAVPRILDHHRRGDPHVRRRRAHAHSHAVQPVAEAAWQGGAAAS